MTNHSTYLIIADGGSLGNGTASAYAYGSYQLVVAEDGRSYKSDKIAFPDFSTNNQAEYLAIEVALIDLINRIESAGYDPSQYTVTIKTDSLLVVNQLNGDCACNNDILIKLHTRVITFCNCFSSFHVVKVPRAEVVKILGH